MKVDSPSWKPDSSSFFCFFTTCGGEACSWLAEIHQCAKKLLPREIIRPRFYIKQKRWNFMQPTYIPFAHNKTHLWRFILWWIGCQSSQNGLGSQEGTKYDKMGQIWPCNLTTLNQPIWCIWCCNTIKWSIVWCFQTDQVEYACKSGVSSDEHSPRYIDLFPINFQ